MRGTSVAESTSGRPLWGAMPHWRLLSRVVTARQLDSKRGCDMSVNPYGGSVSEYSLLKHNRSCYSGM